MLFSLILILIVIKFFIYCHKKIYKADSAKRKVKSKKGGKWLDVKNKILTLVKCTFKVVRADAEYPVGYTKT